MLIGSQICSIEQIHSAITICMAIDLFYLYLDDIEHLHVFIVVVRVQMSDLRRWQICRYKVNNNNKLSKGLESLGSELNNRWNGSIMRIHSYDHTRLECVFLWSLIVGLKYKVIILTIFYKWNNQQIGTNSSKNFTLSSNIDIVWVKTIKLKQTNLAKLILQWHDQFQ